MLMSWISAYLTIICCVHVIKSQILANFPSGASFFAVNLLNSLELKRLFRVGESSVMQSNHSKWTKLSRFSTHRQHKLSFIIARWFDRVFSVASITEFESKSKIVVAH